MTSLSEAIDSVFATYDKDNSGCLDTNEGANFIRDLFQLMGKNISEQGITYALEMMDQNKDGRIGKQELKVILESIED